jgi:uncharacterized FlaG/YvyC family protein
LIETPSKEEEEEEKEEDNEREYDEDEVSLFIKEFNKFIKRRSVTPHVSKPHDYVNHMFMRPKVLIKFEA